MELIRKYRNILIGVGVLLLVFGGYWWWSSGTSEGDGPALVYSPGASDFGAPIYTALEGQEILSALNILRNLSLSGAIFENPAFKSLVDHTVATTSEPRGRPDPFAPLSSEIDAKSAKKK